MKTIRFVLHQLLFAKAIATSKQNTPQNSNKITPESNKSATVALNRFDPSHIPDWQNEELNGWSKEYAQQFADQVRPLLESNFAAILKDENASNREASAAIALLYHSQPRECWVKDIPFGIMGTSVTMSMREGPRSLRTISCCDNLHSEWTSRSKKFESLQTQYFYTSSETSTPVAKLTFIDGACDGPFTQLPCETIKRALCTPELSPVTVTRFEEAWFSKKTREGPIIAYPIPRPTCNIPRSDCMSIWDPFLKQQQEIWGIMYRAERRFDIPLPPWDIFRPSCENNYMEPLIHCDFGTQVQLLHWPTEIEEADICQGSRKHTSLISKSKTLPIRPSEVTSGNFILTSPTPYIFYSTMAHHLGVGETHYNIAIPINTRKLMYQFGWSSKTGSSYPDDVESWKVEQLNLTDLAYIKAGNQSFPIVPVNSYKHHMKCDRGWGIPSISGVSCDGQTIYHDWQPRIRFTLEPSILASIDPKWSRCGYAVQEAWDPPVVLEPPDPKITELAVPTLGPQLTYTKAHPEPTWTTPLATQTDYYQRPQTFFAIVTSIPKTGQQSQPEAKTQAVFTSGSITFTAVQQAQGVFVLQGETFSRGGDPITVGSAVISAFNSGVVFQDSTRISGGTSATIQGLDGGNQESGRPETSAKSSKGTSMRSLPWTKGVYLFEMIVLVSTSIYPNFT